MRPMVGTFPGAAVVHQHAGDFLQFFLMHFHIHFQTVQALLFAGEQHESDRSLRLHTQLWHCLTVLTDFT